MVDLGEIVEKIAIYHFANKNKTKAEQRWPNCGSFSKISCGQIAKFNDALLCYGHNHRLVTYGQTAALQTFLLCL
jgi:hypothetical protein